jgi:hypothetical protein
MGIRRLGSNYNFGAVPGRFESHGQPDTAACPRDVDHFPRQLPKHIKDQVQFYCGLRISDPALFFALKRNIKRRSECRKQQHVAFTANIFDTGVKTVAKHIND